MNQKFLRQSGILLLMPLLLLSFALRAQGASCESADGKSTMTSLSQVGKELDQAINAVKEGSEEKPDLAEQTLYFVSEFNERNLPALQDMADKISGSDLAKARDVSKQFLKRVQTMIRMYNNDQSKLELSLQDPSLSSENSKDSKKLLDGLKVARLRIFKVMSEMQKNLESEVFATCSGYAFYAKTKSNGEDSKEDIRFWQCKSISEELAKDIPSSKRDEKRSHYTITCGKALEAKKIIPLTGMVYSISCAKSASGCPSERDCAGEGKISKVLEKKMGPEGSK